tara:strand:+ start:157 stop:924 length:768 start_codon:yes stop_codon:yes gene_type:complete
MKKILKNNSNIIELLNGNLFDSRMKFDISNLATSEPLNRIESLLKITHGYKVIHIGCGDHLELIDDKIKKKIHLHSLLIESSSDCIGFDLEEKSINHLKSKYKINQVYKADITDEVFDFKNFNKNTDWDFIILGEIIEHLNDPIGFLKCIKNKFTSYSNEILITAPNAYSYQHVLSYNKDKVELINSDHRFWFTPYTLLKIISLSGIEVNELYFADPATNHQKSFFKKIIKSFSPSYSKFHPSHLSSTLIARCKL